MRSEEILFDKVKTSSARSDMADMATLKMLLGMAPDVDSKLLALKLQLKKPDSPDASALVAGLIGEKVLEAAEGFELLSMLSQVQAKPSMPKPPTPAPTKSNKPKTKFVGTDARTLFGLNSPFLSAELLDKLHLEAVAGKKPTLLFVRANGPGDKQWQDPNAENPVQPADPSTPQMITVRGFDAQSKAGMELQGEPVTPGTQDPEFDIPASFCCHPAYQNLKVGNTWEAPEECTLDPKTQIPIKVYRTPEQYGSPEPMSGP